MKTRNLFLLVVLLAMVQVTWAQEPIQYIDRWWDEATQSVKEEVKTLDMSSAEQLTSRETLNVWEDGLPLGNMHKRVFYVKGYVSIDEFSLKCQYFDVDIVLCNGATLVIDELLDSESISRFSEQGRLTIYGQPGGESGRMVFDKLTEWTELHIKGGHVEAEDYLKVSSLYVFGGTLTAQATWNHEAINARHAYFQAGQIRVYGGVVRANTERNRNTAITFDGEMDVFGGTVEAYGGGGSPGGAGIYVNVGVQMIINGGTVSAWAGDDGAAIGGTEDEYHGTIIINGGKVYAYADSDGHGAGIGTGQVSHSISRKSRIFINGGYVEAHGSMDGAGLGSGEDGYSGDITITGGHVVAFGDDLGAGIGAGQDGSCGTITITGGLVETCAGHECGNRDAIGAHAGSDKQGRLVLGDNMKVTAGPGWQVTERTFTTPERVAACLYRRYARIEVCDHEQYSETYQNINGEATKTFHCYTCAFTETTTLDGLPVDAAFSAVVMEPKQQGDAWEYEIVSSDLVQRKTDYVLPEPKHNNLESNFCGWYVTETQAEDSIYICGNEGLLQPGDVIKMPADKDIFIYARHSRLLTLTDGQDNTPQLARLNGTRVNAVLSDRTFINDYQWNSLCLPFDVKNLGGTPLEGATLMELNTQKSSLKNGVLTLAYTRSDSVVAGRPYLFRYAEDMEIASLDDWNRFADRVKNGEAYLNAKLVADIEGVTRAVIGKYCGVFDGQGHSITVNISNNMIWTGLFNNSVNATFKNLRLAGSISGMWPGGLMGSDKASKVINCVVAADITDTSGYYGASGFVGMAANTEFENCLFSGTLHSSVASAAMTVAATPTVFAKNCQVTGDTDAPETYFVYLLGSIRNNSEAYSKALVDLLYNLKNCWASSKKFEWVLKWSEDDTPEKKLRELGSGWKLNLLGELVPKVVYSEFGAPTFHNVTINSSAPVGVSAAGITMTGTYNKEQLLQGDKTQLWLDDDVRLRWAAQQDETIQSTWCTWSLNNVNTHDLNAIVLTFDDGSLPIVELIDGLASSDIITAYKDQLVNASIEGRTLSAVKDADGSWQPHAYTICLPFDIDLRNQKMDNLNDFQLYRLYAINPNTKQMVFRQEAATMIFAGEPYLVVINNRVLKLQANRVEMIDEVWDPLPVGIVVNGEVDPENVVGQWCGSLRKIESVRAAEMRAYALQSAGDFRRIRPDTPEACWNAFRSMFCADDDMESNKYGIEYQHSDEEGYGGDENLEEGPLPDVDNLSFVGDADIPDDSETGIRPQTIVTIDADGTERYFDLSGRLLNGKPNSKGLYIKNGKKYIKK